MLMCSLINLCLWFNLTQNKLRQLKETCSRKCEKLENAYNFQIYVCRILYFIKYSVPSFTLKMMLKYSLSTIHRRYLRKGLRWLLWWINLQGSTLVKLFLKNKNIFFAKNYYEFQVRTILVCALYSINYGKLFVGTLLTKLVGQLCARVAHPRGGAPHSLGALHRLQRRFFRRNFATVVGDEVKYMRQLYNCLC